MASAAIEVAVIAPEPNDEDVIPPAAIVLRCQLHFSSIPETDATLPTTLPRHCHQRLQQNLQRCLQRFRLLIQQIQLHCLHVACHWATEPRNRTCY